MLNNSKKYLQRFWIKVRLHIKFKLIMHQKFKEGSPFTNPKVLSLGFTAEHHLSADRSEFIAPLA